MVAVDIVLLRGLRFQFRVAELYTRELSNMYGEYSYRRILARN
jgi:hypothetical protein